jgi:predicted TIM-barrel enzyme
VQVWADVKKNHSAHAITADVSLGLTAEAVEFMLGDAVIVTGAVTGDPCRVEDVQAAKAHCRLPVILGSGMTVANLGQFFELADGFIIGTHFKKDSQWTDTVDPRRVEAFMTAIARLRNSS